MKLRFKPLSRETWNEFEELFGEKGGCAGCWCMFWRIPGKQFDTNESSDNKKLMKRLVTKGGRPGIIAFDGDRAVGWCSFSPREEYTRLERSRILRPVDDKEVWSVSCFFIDRNYRGKGVATSLLSAAVRAAKKRGAKILEGYPVEPKDGKQYPPAFAWHGVPAIFKSAGFKEVARRSPTRPIMRLELR
jgi:GNAT superfamily N-acetyltransferase